MTNIFSSCYGSTTVTVLLQCHVSVPHLLWWTVAHTRVMIVPAGGERYDIYHRVNPPGSPSTVNSHLFIMINWGHLLCNIGCVPCKTLLLWLIQM